MALDSKQKLWGQKEREHVGNASCIFDYLSCEVWQKESYIFTSFVSVSYILDMEEGT